MIVFHFDYETHINQVRYGRDIWWIGTTEVIDEDEGHEVEIMEQLDAEWAFNL
jgi:hypothetical protein